MTILTLFSEGCVALLCLTGCAPLQHTLKQLSMDMPPRYKSWLDILYIIYKDDCHIWYICHPGSMIIVTCVVIAYLFSLIQWCHPPAVLGTSLPSLCFHDSSRPSVNSDHDLIWWFLRWEIWLYDSIMIMRLGVWMRLHTQQDKGNCTRLTSATL